MKSRADSSPSLTIDELRALCDADFFSFLRIMNATPPNVAPVSREIHKPLCEFYQGPGYRKVIAMPRDWLKSTVFTKWGSIWRYLRDNEERILIAAENERLAGRFLHWIESQILTNKFLRKIYPELQKVDAGWTRGHRWSSFEADMPRIGAYSEPTFTAIGVGGAAQSGHYSTVVIDDIVDKKAQESILVLESVMRWFDNVNELLIQPDSTMPNPSRITIHGTFWFPGDFFCYIQEKYPEYQFRVVPCRKNLNLTPKESTLYVQSDGVEAGESNWPEQFPTKYYVEMEANPEKNLVYWSQHMNDPQAAHSLTTFDHNWYKFYRIETREGRRFIVCEDGEEFLASEVPAYGFIDPGGFSDKRLTKRGSRTALVVAAQPPGSKKKFVLYAGAFKFKNPRDFRGEVYRAHKETKPIHWRFETFGQQRGYLYDLRDESKTECPGLRVVPLECDETENAKSSRVDALKDPMAAGEIYIQRNMYDIIAETKNYPNGVTRDLLDMIGVANASIWTRGAKDDLTRINSMNETRPRVSGYSTGY